MKDLAFRFNPFVQFAVFAKLVQFTLVELKAISQIVVRSSQLQMQKNALLFQIQWGNASITTYVQYYEKVPTPFLISFCIYVT